MVYFSLIKNLVDQSFLDFASFLAITLSPFQSCTFLLSIYNTFVQTRLSQFGQEENQCLKHWFYSLVDDFEEQDELVTVAELVELVEVVFLFLVDFFLIFQREFSKVLRLFFSGLI